MVELFIWLPFISTKGTIPKAMIIIYLRIWMPPKIESQRGSALCSGCSNLRWRGWRNQGINGFSLEQIWGFLRWSGAGNDLDLSASEKAGRDFIFLFLILIGAWPCRRWPLLGVSKSTWGDRTHSTMHGSAPAYANVVADRGGPRLDRPKSKIKPPWSFLFIYLFFW